MGQEKDIRILPLACVCPVPRVHLLVTLSLFNQSALMFFLKIVERKCGHLFLDARSSLTDLSVSLRTLYAFSSIPLESSMVKSCDCLNPERERSLWEVQVGSKGSTNQLPLLHDWLLYLASHHGACGLLTASQKEGLGEGPRPLS